MTDRERLIELIADSGILCEICGENTLSYCAEALANHLLANGVTFATDTKVGDKWTPTDERMPDELPKDGNDWAEMMRPSVDVLVKLKGSEELRTAWYSYSSKIWVDVASGRYMGNLVTHWMPLPEPPAATLNQGQEL